MLEIRRFPVLTAVLFVGISVLLLRPAPGVCGLAVFPQVIEIGVEPGQMERGEIELRNSGEKPLTVALDVFDFRLDREGRGERLPPGRGERSLYPFVVLGRGGIELDPGDVEAFEYTIKIPEGQPAGTYWLAVYIQPDSQKTPLQVEDGEARVGLKLTIRHRVLILVTVGEPRPRGRITGMHFVPGEHLEIAFENTGAFHCTVSGRVELRDKTGETIRQLSLDRLFVLPSGTRLFRLPCSKFSGLPAGRYLALAVVDFGGRRLVAGQLAFEQP